MNTTTALQRNLLLTQHDIRLPAGFPGGQLPPTRETPGHDFLVLNQHPDFTPEVFHWDGAAAPQRK